MQVVLEFIMLAIGAIAVSMVYTFLDIRYSISKKFFKILPVAKENKAAMTFGIWVTITIVVFSLFKSTIHTSPYIARLISGASIGFTSAITLGMKKVAEDK